MSTPQPPRRRRIAGESKPGAPAARTTPVKKPASRRPVKSPQRDTPAATPPRPPAPQRPAAAPVVAPETTDEATSRERRFDLSAVRRSWRSIAFVALAVAALVFGAVFGYRGIAEWRGGDDIVSAHAEAASTAATSAETIFTYRYDKLDEHLEDAKATMTSSFATKFETISPALNDLAPQRKIQVKAETRDAAPLECGRVCAADKATILVFIDQARLADGDDQPTVFGNRVELEMVKSKGTWLVNDIKAL